MDKIAAERNDLVAATRKRILAILSPEQIGSMQSSKPAGGLRSRTPGGPVPHGSVATPSGGNKTRPKFGDSATSGEGKKDRINPSSGGGDKNRSRDGGQDN